MDNSATCRVALIQMQCDEDPVVNLDRAVELIESAAGREAKIICLPELFRTQYFCQSEDHSKFALAEPIPGPTTARLAALAKQLQIVIVASLFEKRAAGVYHNSAVVIDADGQLLGTYRKMHIPDDPLYYEKFYFTPGDLGFRTFETRYATIGVLVCWDQWFPEAARLTAMQGADLILYPTAIGWHPHEKHQYGEIQHDSWEIMQRSHAIANGCYVAAVNRVGHEGPTTGGIEFWGQSFACGPDGVMLHRADATKSEIVAFDVDPHRVEVVRTHWPFFRDRRIDSYSNLTERFCSFE